MSEFLSAKVQSKVNRAFAIPATQYRLPTHMKLTGIVAKWLNLS